MPCRGPPIPTAGQRDLQARTDHSDQPLGAWHWSPRAGRTPLHSKPMALTAAARPDPQRHPGTLLGARDPVGLPKAWLPVTISATTTFVASFLIALTSAHFNSLSRDNLPREGIQIRLFFRQALPDLVDPQITRALLALVPVILVNAATAGMILGGKSHRPINWISPAAVGVVIAEESSQIWGLPGQN
jgi:hypothetical protein